MPTPRRTRVLELRSVRGTGGGPEKTILLGAAAASRDEFEIVVCYLRDRRDGVFSLDARAASAGIRYVEVHERHSMDVGIWPQLRRVIERHHIDIVHAHEYKTDLLALLLARRFPVVPVATAHGWTGNSRRERYVYYPADKRILRRYPCVIAVSSEIRGELLRHGARPDRVPVVLNAIDPERFRRHGGRREAVRHALQFFPQHVVIGGVGRLEKQKRFDLLMEAVVPVARRDPNVRLVLVGDGSLRANLEGHAARLGLTGQCVFLGHRTDVDDLHHAFDLFVQSSDYEGTSNAVLEAMAMSTPIVATDVGGTGELAVRDVHALLVPQGDVSALGQAIATALEDKTASQRRTDAARQRIETELSFAARTRRLEGIYRELIEDRNARRC